MDVLDFLERAKGEGVDALDAAARLYRGPLLDGLALREAGFADWLSAERMRLHDIALGVLRRLAAAARAGGDDVAARDALERAVAHDPLSEEAQRDLARLHLDHGRAADAVRQLAACAGILRRELQVEPGPQTMALWREALACGPPAVAGPAGDAAGERKQATALAVALTPGPGSLADPEDLEALLDAAARRAVEVIRRHGGLVLRASAEGIAAVFGAPHALEDHAARACRAALTCSRPPGRSRLAWASASIPARSCCMAKPGRRRRSAAKDLRPLPAAGGAHRRRGRRGADHGDRGDRGAGAQPDPLRCGGGAVPGPKTPPLPLFRPTGANRPGAEGRPATEGEMVEREAELAALSAAISPVAQGSGRLVALVGEAGVGKSRLVREFLARALPEGWLAVMAAADPQSSDVAYSTVAALLRAYFELDKEVVGALGDRLGAALRALDPDFADQAIRPLLALLHGAPAEDDGWAALEPAQRRRRMVEAVKGLLHRRAAAQPLLVVVEDLHWLDAASRQVVESLVESLAASRLALLVNFRPEFAHAWAGLGHYRQVRVEPLSTDGAQALLDRLLGRHPALAPLRQRLAGRAGGNSVLPGGMRAQRGRNAEAGGRGRSLSARRGSRGGGPAGDGTGGHGGRCSTGWRRRTSGCCRWRRWSVPNRSRRCWRHAGLPEEAFERGILRLNPGSSWCRCAWCPMRPTASDMP